MRAINENDFFKFANPTIYKAHPILMKEKGGRGNVLHGLQLRLGRARESGDVWLRATIEKWKWWWELGIQFLAERSRRPTGRVAELLSKNGPRRAWMWCQWCMRGQVGNFIPSIQLSMVPFTERKRDLNFCCKWKVMGMVMI